MNHESELTNAIKKEAEKLGDLIDSTAPYIFEYLDFDLMIDSLIRRNFKRDEFKPIDLNLLPPEMLIDNDGVPIPHEQFLNHDYLGTHKRFNCAMAVFYWREINRLIKKNEFVKAMPMLTVAFGLVGFAIEHHALDIDKSIKVRLNGTKGGQVHAKKEKDYPIVKEFWLKKNEGMTAKECATFLEKSGLVESTHGEILKLITQIKKELKNSSSQP